jgi:hypothetical protein
LAVIKNKLESVKKNEMSVSEKIIEETLLGEKPEITAEIVEYSRENPDDLDLIIDKEYFHSKFIRFFFIVGLIITVGSRILKFFFHDTWAEFINDIILDVFSELGIAIFGGAIVAFILEKMKQSEIIDKIKETEKLD